MSDATLKGKPRELASCVSTRHENEVRGSHSSEAGQDAVDSRKAKSGHGGLPVALKKPAEKSEDTKRVELRPATAASSRPATRFLTQPRN